MKKWCITIGGPTRCINVSPEWAAWVQSAALARISKHKRFILAVIVSTTRLFLEIYGGKALSLRMDAYTQNTVEAGRIWCSNLTVGQAQATCWLWVANAICSVTCCSICILQYHACMHDTGRGMSPHSCQANHCKNALNYKCKVRKKDAQNMRWCVIHGLTRCVEGLRLLCSGLIAARCIDWPPSAPLISAINATNSEFRHPRGNINRVQGTYEPRNL